MFVGRVGRASRVVLVRKVTPLVMFDARVGKASRVVLVSRVTPLEPCLLGGCVEPLELC